jgi:uroporphyrinogen-III synthase
VRILVTRPRGQAGPLVERLEQLGHEVAVSPLIEIEPIGPEEIDVAGYDWVVVTSANGANQLARRRRGDPARIAAVGPATAAALAERGLPVHLVPRSSSQEGLLAELPRPAGRVLFVAAEGARRLLVDELAADFVPVYRTRPVRRARVPESDLVVLASPSAARTFASLGIGIPAVSIGPQTTAAAREAGVRVIAEAPRPTVEGLVAAVAVGTARQDTEGARARKA